MKSTVLAVAAATTMMSFAQSAYARDLHRRGAPLPIKATRDTAAAVAGARPHGAAGRCDTWSARIRAHHSISHAIGRVGAGRERSE